MKTDNFRIALAEWRESGGCMNVILGDARSPDAWEVVEGDDLEERITCSIFDATVNALETGGLSPRQISYEMRHWTD